MFEIRCPSCGGRARALEEHIGRRATCPLCHNKFVIPGPSPEPAPDPLAFLSETNEAAPPPLSPLYGGREPGDRTVRISPDSPAGAVDQRALAGFITALNLAPGEDIFFFQKTTAVAKDIRRLINLYYHLTVTSNRVIVIAANKRGNVSRSEFPFSAVLAADADEGLMWSDLNLVVAGPTEHVVTYSFLNRFVNREHLPAVVDYIRERKGGFDGETGIRISADSPVGAVDRQALRDFIGDLKLAPEEDIFFFQHTLTPPEEFTGFFSPSYRLAVTSNRAIAIARDKNGKVARAEFPFSGILAADYNHREGSTLCSLEFVVTDRGERVVSYTLRNGGGVVPAVVDYIRKRKGGFDESRLALLSQPKQVGFTIIYVSGPFDVKSGTPVALILDAHEIAARTPTRGAANSQQLLRIPYRSVTGVSVETAERLGKLRTLGALALAGPLAAVFVGFGLKKKDKFLKIDFNDDTGLNVAAIFGGLVDMDTLAGKILAHRRDALLADGTHGPGAVPAQAAPTGQPGPGPAAPQPPAAPSAPREDVTGLLEKLASLREKGIITDEEFQEKKGDLLSRL
jgi:hypothetical protein